MSKTITTKRTDFRPTVLILLKKKIYIVLPLSDVVSMTAARSSDSSKNKWRCERTALVNDRRAANRMTAERNGTESNGASAVIRTAVGAIGRPVGSRVGGG